MRPDTPKIVDAQSEEEVYRLLAAALESRISSSLHDDLDAFVGRLRTLADGFRAMGATYQLDISITLDDLGWHFGNWHHHDYNLETARGLRVLGATRPAELFEAAYGIARQYWAELGAPDWTDWYHGSPLEKAIAPVDREMRALCGNGMGILGFWVQYARRNPELLIG